MLCRVGGRREGGREGRRGEGGRAKPDTGQSRRGGTHKGLGGRMEKTVIT